MAKLYLQFFPKSNMYLHIFLINACYYFIIILIIFSAKMKGFSIVDSTVDVQLPVHKQDSMDELTKRAVKKIEELSVYTSRQNSGVFDNIIPQIVAVSI